MPHVNWHQKLAPKNNPANSPLALSVIFGGLNPKIGAKFSNDLRSETLLQYFPDTCLPAPCSDISRSRNSVPESLAQIPLTLILPLLSPLLTGVRTSWKAGSRAVGRLESA